MAGINIVNMQGSVVRGRGRSKDDLKFNIPQMKVVSSIESRASWKKLKTKSLVIAGCVLIWILGIKGFLFNNQI